MKDGWANTEAMNVKHRARRRRETQGAAKAQTQGATRAQTQGAMYTKTQRDEGANTGCNYA